MKLLRFRRKGDGLALMVLAGATCAIVIASAILYVWLPRFDALVR